MSTTTPQLLAVILAAGKGTRMKSDLPKVLVPVHQRPMIEYVVDTLDQAGVQQIVVVVGYRADLVREQLSRRSKVSFADQTEQLGTGHAVMMCRDELAKAPDAAVLIVAGDSPMLRADSVQQVFAEFQKSGAACLLGTAHKADPFGLGRIVRNSQGDFEAIVEQKDATPEQQHITEVNLSCYVFRSRDLLAALDQLSNNNAQKEYYLTDVPAILKHAGKKILAVPCLQPSEALSINTPEELEIVATEMTKLGYVK
jgi:UDP-N-acetylglucosamine diphosphorylase/glucosamine-1-phosphate N-acetyltransferase